LSADLIAIYSKTLGPVSNVFLLLTF